MSALADPVPKGTRVLLVGGGHGHVEVLRSFALQPDPAIALTLVSPASLVTYSGMIPGLVAQADKSLP